MSKLDILKGGGNKSIKGIYVRRMGEYRYFTRNIKTFFKVVGNLKEKTLTILDNEGL